MIAGRCKCGNVTYRGTRAEAPAFRCYCRDCQQLTGTGHSEMLPLLVASFKITGPTKTYEMQGGSGLPTWSTFCTDCGSPLTRQSERMKQFVYVHAGSLDNPAEYEPAKSIYGDSAQDWDKPLDY